MRTILLSASIAALAAGMLPGQAPPQLPGLVPTASEESDLKVRLDPVGRMPTPANTNPTSPVAAGSQLLLIDQRGYLYRWDGSAGVPLITPKGLPSEVKPLGAEPLMNVAADRAGTTVYTMFVSSTAPKNVPAASLRVSPTAGMSCLVTTSTARVCRHQGR